MDPLIYFATHAAFSNLVMPTDGVKTPAQITRPDGLTVPSSPLGSGAPEHYWIPTDHGWLEVVYGQVEQYDQWLVGQITSGTMQTSYLAVSDGQALLQDLWAHHQYGTSLDPAGLQVKHDDLANALKAAPALSKILQGQGFDVDAVWAYAMQEAPLAVELVGVAHA